MDKKAWIIASVLSALVIGGFVGLSTWERARELDRTRKELEVTREAVAKAAEQVLEQANAARVQFAKAQEVNAQLQEETKQLEILRGQFAKAQQTIEQLQEETKKAATTQKTLEQEMRSAIESKDITISQLRGRLTVNILDRILFDSGEAVLRAEGEKVLRQIAVILAQHPKRQIHVIGHTDNVPIRPGSKSGHASNWELSTARATAAVRFLAEKAGVDPRRLGALGYGEFHPLADNATPEGRAKNRRIALVVLAEEIAPTDVPPTPAPVAPPQ